LLVAVGWTGLRPQVLQTVAGRCPARPEAVPRTRKTFSASGGAFAAGTPCTKTGAAGVVDHLDFPTRFLDIWEAAVGRSGACRQRCPRIDRFPTLTEESVRTSIPAVHTGPFSTYRDYMITKTSGEASLTDVEQALVDHTTRGKLLDLAADEPVDEAAMRTCGSSRTIRAAVVRDILRGRLATDPDPHGLRLRGARIAGCSTWRT
jgi:hypothetical protein